MITALFNPAVPHKHPRTGRLVWVFHLLLLIALPLSSPAQEQLSAEPSELGEAPILSAGSLKYRPGRGFRLGSSGLVFGGFTNVKAETEQEAGGEFAIDNVNVFIIFDRFTRFRAVAELQLKDVFVADEKHTGAQDFGFDVRRLFGDFTLLDELHVRAGTFLTPVGYWNLILAPPLTWTTESPLIVEEVFFQPTTTGLMVHGSTGVGSGQFGYSLFSQFLDPLQEDSDLNPPDHTAGARLTYDPAPGWSVGATYQAAETDSDWSHLGDVFLLWQQERGEVLGESLVQDGDGFGSPQWGAYLQGVLHVFGPFSLVGRYEHANLDEEPAVNVVTVGGVWKPFPFMALKAEYRFADDKLENGSLDGFYSSFTSFF